MKIAVLERCKSGQHNRRQNGKENNLQILTSVLLQINICAGSSLWVTAGISNRTCPNWPHPSLVPPVLVNFATFYLVAQAETWKSCYNFPLLIKCSQGLDSLAQTPRPYPRTPHLGLLPPLSPSTSISARARAKMPADCHNQNIRIYFSISEVRT